MRLVHWSMLSSPEIAVRRAPSAWVCVSACLLNACRSSAPEDGAPAFNHNTDACSAPGISSAPDPDYIFGRSGDLQLVVKPREAETDAANVQWAIDNVGVGGTVLLCPGTFDFSAEGSTSWRSDKPSVMSSASGLGTCSWRVTLLRLTKQLASTSTRRAISMRLPWCQTSTVRLAGGLAGSTALEA